jgi:pyruvate/2-oxoacid:ferredoxin oxidoreductase beta subunit
MTNRGLIVGIALVAALAASGCATKVRMSSGKMCTAHGGTYNASTQMCTYKAQTLSAKQACEAQGGTFMADQNCEVE